MKYGPWIIPDDLDSEIEFAKRINNANTIKKHKIRISMDGNAEIQGSGLEPYQVSLTDCTCADFAFIGRRGIPCKHMIRLAIETGKYHDIPRFNPNSSLKDEVSGIVFQLQRLWRNGAITSDAYQKSIKALMDSIKQMRD